MVAFTGWSNEGVNSLANSLSGLGQSFGNAYLKNQQMQQERELLSDFGKKYTSGDFEGAMQSAIAMGKPELAIDIKSKIDQQAADSLAMAPISGVGASPLAAVSNPNDPRGIRNLNPGNIQDGDFAKSQPGYVGSDGRFAKFDTMEHGAAANASLLQNYANKGLNTVEGIISRYAPPSENNTKNYILNVAHDIGVDPRQPLNLNDPAVMGKLQQSIFKIENGQNVNLGGQPQRVQVADASGAIPQSANVDALIKKRDNIVRGLSMPGISNNARQSLSAQLQVVNSDIERADKVSQQPGMRVQAEADQRAVLADRYNLTGEAKQQFVLTGKLPKEDQQLTAGDRDAIRTADENIQAANSVIGALTQAKSLSKQAWGFPGAGVAAKAGSLAGNETAIATTELDNMISGQALDSLRAIFGGNPTEGERKILLDIQGSSSQPDAVRQKIFDRAISAAQRRLQFNQDRANELRGGTYYKPRDGSQPQGSGNVTAAKPIPSNILEEARAAIPRKGREAVINLLRQQGFDTSGL
jgi:hypothetical protein